ncbi:uncharacterized protein LOC142004668 isoform X2 [Carettochelys insculpta]|uniref:uncharacterized protein LOC142004668 isoform X2 n=1 Tax=Carettochelys insculpta TaxID=44489 RepID=UPI003EB97CCB
MALMFLLRLLASLQSLPRPVSPSGLLPAPTLALFREYPVYAPGEKVDLRCQAPAGRDAKEYRFFSQRGQGSPIRVPQDEIVPSMLPLPAEKGTVGSYTCAYRESSGQTFSENSSSVSVALAAPQLTVSPERLLYTTGESVNLTCSGAGVSDMSGVRFFRNGQSLPTQEFRLSPHSYRASIQLSVTEHPAEYSCEYNRSVKGKEFTSERSQKVLIALKAHPDSALLIYILLAFGDDLLLGGVLATLIFYFRKNKRAKE